MSHIDDVLKALCEPTRRRIVEKLTAGPQPVSQPRTVCRIVVDDRAEQSGRVTIPVG